jgi:hypothetical protein
MRFYRCEGELRNHVAKFFASESFIDDDRPSVRCSAWPIFWTILVLSKHNFSFTPLGTGTDEDGKVGGATKA